MMIKMQEIMRKFLVDVAKAADAEMTEEMATFIKKLTVDGLYAEATEDEIELFDQLFETMEDNQEQQK
jgi:hypothetical protein